MHVHFNTYYIYFLLSLIFLFSLFDAGERPCIYKKYTIMFDYGLLIKA